jgi:hypothetical protein
VTDISLPIAYSLAALAMTLDPFSQITPGTRWALVVAGVVILFATQLLGIAITAPVSSATAGALERGATIWLMLALAIVPIYHRRRAHREKSRATAG